MAARVVLLITSLLLFEVVQAGFDASIFRESEESLLEEYSDRELLDVAAKYNTWHIVSLTTPSQTAVSQQGTTILVDCLPWLNRCHLQNGTIQWKYIQLDHYGNPAYGQPILIIIMC
jgi:hypothetical protein